MRTCCVCVCVCTKHCLSAPGYTELITHYKTLQGKAMEQKLTYYCHIDLHICVGCDGARKNSGKVVVWHFVQ